MTKTLLKITFRIKDHIRTGILPLRIMKRRRLSYFLIFIPKWQTSRANVMSSLKTWNKLPSSRAFSAAEKWTVRITEVSGFLYFSSKTETCDAKNSWEFVVDNIICIVKIDFEKRGTLQSKFDKYKLIFYLAPHSAYNCSSCIANCICSMFQITQFLATEALGKNTLADKR